MDEPEHMDRWARNKRLYETLKGMGLYVDPIPCEADPERIDRMIVAADLPTEAVPEGSVVPPVQRSEVGDVVRTAPGPGNGVVVEFPPVVRSSVSVVRELHSGAEAVPTIDSGVVTGDRSPLGPHVESAEEVVVESKKATGSHSQSPSNDPTGA